MNKAFAREPDSQEVDEKQIGKGYAFTNFGEIAIDWSARKLSLLIKTEEGAVVRSQSIDFDEIKAQPQP